jgi:predicted dehydrogenase
VIRVGLVGAGLHALVHLEGFAASRNLKLNAVCDVVPGRAAEIAAQYGIPHVCETVAEMADRNLVDLVDIVTPPLSHYDVVADALNRGLHVLCEKPLSLDADEAKAMVELAEKSGQRAFMAFQRRYDPAVIHVHNLLLDGFIGDVVLSNTSVMVNWGKLKGVSQAQGYRGWISDVATGGGFIAGALPHYVDLLRFLLGDIASVVSHGGPAGRGPAAGGRDDRPDDTVIMGGSLEAGGMYNLCATWAAENPTNERWEIVGTKRSLIIDSEGRVLVTTAAGLDELEVPATLAVAPELFVNRGFGFGNAGAGFGSLISDVCGSLIDHTKPYCAAFSDGARSAEIIAQLQARRVAEMAH